MLDFGIAGLERGADTMRMPHIRASWSRLHRDLAGVAAVEMALLAPVFLLGAILMLDFGYAFNAKLRLTNAVTAASQYALQNGRSLTSGDVAGFNSKVAGIVTRVAKLSLTPTVTVTFNGIADGSRASNYYCLSGPPLVWVSTGTSTAGCGGNVSSGRFVIIEIEASQATLFPSNPVLGSAVHFSDRAIVRVE